MEISKKPEKALPVMRDRHLYGFIALCLLISLPALIFAYLIEKAWETAERDRADRRALLVAREISAEIGRQVEDNAHIVEALAKLVEIRGTLDSARLQKMATAQRAPFIPFSSLIYIANAAGIAVAYDPPVDKFGTPNIGTDYSDRDYYKELVRTGGHGPAIIGPVRMGRRAHAPNVQTAAAAHDPKGNFWAFTQGSIDLATVQPDVEQILAEVPDLKVVAASKEGKAFIHPDKNALEEMRDLSKYPLFQPPENLKGEFRTGIDEEKVAVRAAVLPISQREINWRVVVYQPESLVQADAAVMRRQTWTVLGAALSAGFILAGLVFWKGSGTEGRE